MNLPYQSNLPVPLLAACFKNTSATYKFYWFLAILNRVELDTLEISKKDLFADMIANAWYTVNYFQISFGKQDKLQSAIKRIKEMEGLPIDAAYNQISKRLSTTTNPETIKLLYNFNAEVPHRFLSPWFPASNEKHVYEASQQKLNNCLYTLYLDRIVINANWVSYLKQNMGILRGFCYWNLALYLQAKNPNVPDIPNKITKKLVRGALTEQRKFWNIVIAELGSVNCIYTNNTLSGRNYAIEHFIPYAFVAHDLIWNLIPADRSFNSVKSDKLPSLDRYFESFFNLQQMAVDIIRQKMPNNKLFEDYLTIFPELGNQPLNKQKFREQLQPLITIANNNGFQFM
jgi:hypothetical protein